MAANPYQDWLDGYADEYGVDRRIVNFVAERESGRDANAVSPKGAVGVMQIMPDTAAQPGGEPLVGETEDLRNPEVNIRAGSDYLSRMLKKYDNKIDFALAAYNWGQGNTDEWIANGAKYSELPEETYDYVQAARAELSGLSAPQRERTEAEKLHGVKAQVRGVDTPWIDKVAEAPPRAAPAPSEKAEEGRGLFRTVGDIALKAGVGTTGLMAAAADTAQPDPRPPGVSFLDQMLSGIGASVGDWAGLDALSEYGHTEQVRIAREYLRENERRQAEGEPSLEEERKGQVATRGAEYFNKFSDTMRDAMSEYQKKQDRGLGMAADEGVKATMGYLWDNPSSLVALIAESGAMMGAAAGVAKLAKVGAIAGGASQPAVRAATIAGSVGGETVVAAGMNAQQAQMIIEQLSAEELGALPEAQKLLEQGMSIEDARGVLRQRAGDATWGFSIVSNLVTLGMSQKLGANVVADVLARTAKETGEKLGRRAAAKHLGLGAAKEAGQEFFQEGGDALASNIGEISAGVREPEDLWKGVAGQAVIGAAAGGVMGGLMSMRTYDKAGIQDEAQRRAESAVVDEINSKPPPPPPGAAPQPEPDPIDPQQAAADAQQAEDEAWKKKFNDHINAGASPAAARGAADMDIQTSRRPPPAPPGGTPRLAGTVTPPPAGSRVNIPDAGPPAPPDDTKVQGKLIKPYKAGDSLIMEDGSRVTLTEKTARQAAAMARRINSGIGVLPAGIDLKKLAGAVAQNEQVATSPEMQAQVASEVGGIGTTGTEQLEMELNRKPMLIEKPEWVHRDAKNLVPLTPTQAKDVQWALDDMESYWTDPDLAEQRVDKEGDQPTYYKTKHLPKVMKQGNKSFLKPSPSEEMNDDLHWRITNQLPGMVDENVVEGLSPADKKAGKWMSPAQGRARQTAINKFGDKMDTRREGLPAGTKPSGTPTAEGVAEDGVEVADDGKAPKQGILLTKRGKPTVAARTAGTKGTTVVAPAPVVTPFQYKLSALQKRQIDTVLWTPEHPSRANGKVTVEGNTLTFRNEDIARVAMHHIRGSYGTEGHAQPSTAMTRSMLSLADKIDKDIVTVTVPEQVGSPGAASRELIAEEKGELAYNTEQLLDIVGANAYAADIVNVSVKELVQNAFDAIKASDFMGVSTARQMLIETDKEGRTVRVTDDGIGMNADIVRKAFLTIAGTDKSDLPPHLRSGGLGLAKVAFLLGSESTKLRTTRDGVTIEIEATSEQIKKGDFRIKSYKAQPGEIGTVVEVTLPEQLVDHEGRVVDVEWPSNFNRSWSFNKHAQFLGKPLIYPGLIATFKQNGITKPTNMGEDFNSPENKDYDDTPYLTSGTMEWGTVEIYMSLEDDTGANHQVLSSGVYQFDSSVPYTMTSRVPRNIILDFKPNVSARSTMYPFNPTREDFRGSVAKDVAAIKNYVRNYYHVLTAQALAATFQKPVAIPKMNPDSDKPSVFARNDLRDAKIQYAEQVAAQGDAVMGVATVPSRLEPINIKDGVVTDAAGNELMEEVEKQDADGDKYKQFEPTEQFPDVFDFNVEPIGTPDETVQFQNNVGPKILEVGEQYGNPMHFFAQLGSIFIELRQTIDDAFDKDGDARMRIGWGSADGVSTEYYSGIAIDKDYGGVNIKVPFRASFLNPFYHRKKWGTQTKEGVAFNFFDTMVHESAHIETSGHDNDFVIAMLRLNAYLADIGIKRKFEDRIFDILDRHWATFEAMETEYNDYDTKNVGKSLEKYGSAAKDDARPEGDAGDAQGFVGDQREQGSSGAVPADDTAGEPDTDSGSDGRDGGGAGGGVVPPLHVIALPPPNPGEGPLFPYYQSEKVDPNTAEEELDNKTRIDVRRTTSRPVEPTIASRRTPAERTKAEEEQHRRTVEYLFSRTVGVGDIMNYWTGSDIRDRTGSGSLGVSRSGTPPPRFPPDDPLNIGNRGRNRRPGASRLLAKRAWGKFRSNFIENWQDNFIQIYNLQKILTDSKGVVADQWQLHGAMTRSGVMVDREMKLNELRYIDPLMDNIIKGGMEIEQADTFAAANHSPYRNYYVWNVRQGRRKAAQTEQELRISGTQASPLVGRNHDKMFGSPSGVVTSEAKRELKKLVDKYGDKALSDIEDSIFALAEYQRNWLAPISSQPETGHDLLTTPQYEAWTPDPAFVEEYRNIRDRQGVMAAHNFDNYTDISFHDWMLKMHSVTYVPLKDVSMTEEQRRLMDRIELATKTYFIESSVWGDEVEAALGRDGKGLGSQPISHLLVRTLEAVVRGVRNQEQSKRIVAAIQEIADDRVGVVSEIVPAASLSTAGTKLNMMGNRKRPRWPTPRSVPGNRQPMRVVHKMGDQEQVALIYDADLGASMTKQVGSAAINKLGRTYMEVSRVMRELQTTHNPGFVMTNPFREIETALLQVGNIPGVTPEQEAVMRRKLMEGGVRNMYDWASDYWAETQTPDLPISNFDAARRERRQFIRDMMQAGFHSSVYKPFDEVEMQRELLRMQKKLLRTGKGKHLNGIPAAMWDNTFRLYGRYMDLAAVATENAPRLIVGFEVYKLKRAEGLTHEEAINHAANVAHDQSVNFQRVGRLVQALRLNKAYHFFNPAVQGTARWVKYMSSKRGAKVMASMYALGILTALINRMLAGEDDEGRNNFEVKAEKWKRERNLLMVIPGTGGEYISIPLAYGLNYPFALGDLTVSTMLGASDNQMSVEEAAAELMPNFGRDDPYTVPGHILRLAMTSFLPLEGNVLSTGGVLNTIVPSVVAPLVDINLTNRDWKNMPIQPEPYVGQPQLVPDSYNVRDAMAKDSLAAMSYWIAQSVNDVTGDEFTPGMPDWSPYSIAYMIKSYTGGAGIALFRMIDSANYMIAGDWKEAARQTPVLRRFYGLGESRYSVRNRYNKLRGVLEPLMNQRDELNARAGPYQDDDINRRNLFRDANPGLDSMLLQLKGAESRLAGLARDRAALKDMTSRTDVQQRKLESLEERMTDQMFRFNMYYFKQNVE